MTDEPATTTEVTTDEAKAKPKRPALSAETLEYIFEEWVAHPDRRECWPILEHERMAKQPGWWFSGRRGFGKELEPLPDELAQRLTEREETGRSKYT